MSAEELTTDEDLKARLADLQRAEAARRARLGPGEMMVFAQAFAEYYERAIGPYSSVEEAARARLVAIDRGYACVMALRYSVETAREKFGADSDVTRIVEQMLEQGEV